MKTTKSKSLSKVTPEPSSVVTQKAEEKKGLALARAMLGPGIRHGQITSAFSNKVLGPKISAPDVNDYTETLDVVLAQTERGDLAIATGLLTAQAVALDSMFTEFARRAASNMGEYMGAAETYARLAMKAQSNCRATLETLAKLHQPREQTVRHVHVNEGGQAVIADEFHNHKGGE